MTDQDWTPWYKLAAGMLLVAQVAVLVLIIRQIRWFNRKARELQSQINHVNTLGQALGDAVSKLRKES